MVQLAAQPTLKAPLPSGKWSSLARRGGQAERNPVEEWTSAFERWISDGAEFREFESNEFFPNSESPLELRMHRGWLCDLISSGELLAVTLLRESISEDVAAPLMKQLDEFLLCFSTTLDTWHAPDDRRETQNPLDQFCAL